MLGDTRIYAFPGANGSNGNGATDINKLLLSTSGLSLINTLMDEGKLGSIATQISQLLRSNGNSNTSVKPAAEIYSEPSGEINVILEGGK